MHICKYFNFIVVLKSCLSEIILSIMFFIFRTKIKMSISPENDSLVKDITLVNKSPYYLHGYIIPFILLYSVAAAFLMQYSGFENYGLWIVVLVCIFLVQVLTILSCFWSVDMRCILTCKRVSKTFHFSL